MRRDYMLKMSLMLSLIGLLGLSSLAHISSPPVVEISEVGENLGRTVVVRGIIASVSYHPDVTFLEVCKDGCVKVVFFDLPSWKLVKGDLVEVEGKVKLYEGEVEVVAEKVLLLSPNN